MFLLHKKSKILKILSKIKMFLDSVSS